MISRIIQPRHIVGLLLIAIGFSILLSNSDKLPVSRFASVGSQVAQVPIIPDVPRDAIPPLDFPDYDTVEEGDRAIGSDEFVLGVEIAGDARAYPIKIMNWHEIVNDEIGGVPVAVTYCPLCRSGIVFDRRLERGEISFGNTGALYESAMVMYDRETNSFWNHVNGRAISGELAGRQVTALPSSIATWGEWKERHPETTILSRNTGFRRNYGSDVFQSYIADPNSEPGFPVSSIDERLAIKEPVVGLTLNGHSKAYVPRLSAGKTISDNIGGRKVEVVVNKAGTAADIYLVKGGERNLAPQTNALWFSWAVNNPRTEIYQD